MNTRKDVRDLFYYCEKTFCLRWIKSTNSRVKDNDIAGNIRKDGYRSIRIGGKLYYAHRLIWIYHYGEIPKDCVIDHKDGNPINNNIDNLQIATTRQNMVKQKSKPNPTGYVGIRKTKSGKYQANIRNGSFRECLGTFDAAIDAAIAYDNRARELNGKFAILNFPS